MSKLSKFIFIFSLIIIAACTQKPAQIVNKNNLYYPKNNKHNLKKSYQRRSDIEYSNRNDKTKLTSRDINIQKNNKISSKSLANEISANQINEIIIINLTGEENLSEISNNYQIQPNKILKLNNLKDPSELKKISKLKISLPDTYLIKKGDTLFSVSKKYQINPKILAAINNLEDPYILKLDQKISLKIHSQSTSQNTLAGNAINQNQKIANSNIAKPSSNNSVGYISELDNKEIRFILPITITQENKIISKFGPKEGGLYNDGINISTKTGQLIKSAEDGVVAYVGNELKGYGNLVIIKHANNFITAYAHLSKFDVTVNQKVKKGQKIAEAGSTGNVDKPQLYFSIRKDKVAVDPKKYLPLN